MMKNSVFSAKAKRWRFLFLLFLLIVLILCFNYENILISSNKYAYYVNKIVNTQTCELIDRNKNLIYFTINNSTYPKFVILQKNNSINFDCLNRLNSTWSPKTILLWNEYFGDNKFAYGLGKRTPFIKNNCPVFNCEITNDKSRLNESDLVVVHGRDAFQRPKHKRSEKQRWVFLIFESPVHTNDLTDFDDVFNLTATYNVDSDFPGAYSHLSYFKWEMNKTFDESHDYSRGKTRLAAALVTNCRDNSYRLKYIQQLRTYAPVDMMGKCGSPCPETGQKKCMDFIYENYKFFLAFENSICKDYITEKFFKLLRKDIVPVVLGGGNYEYFIPKSGYIDVKDFRSVKHLAEYLLYLSNNKTAYNAYFKWKKFISLEEPWVFNSLCDMCIQLHIETHYGMKYKRIESMDVLWGKNKNCAHSIPNTIEVAQLL